MNNFKNSASDSNYHSRHARRTLRRAEQIAAQIDGPAKILDIGCNNGITSQFLLDSGKASHVTGVELHASTVAESLLANPNFDLIEGNIVNLEIQQRFDVIIYGAVHHHIVNFNGLSVAVQTLQKLIALCDGSLFFETGQIGEGGRWRWQRKQRKYFRTDEEHFFYLMRSIEDQISSFDVIGRFWIHGIRRYYLQIDVDDSSAEVIPDSTENLLNWPEPKVGPYTRTFGSRDQTLQLESDAQPQDSPTLFWSSEVDGGQFIKQHRDIPIAAKYEYLIGKQLDLEWSVKPLGLTHDRSALVFPWLEGAVPISHFSEAPRSIRQSIANQVIEIFKDAYETSINLEPNLLLAPTQRSKVRLIDVCDFNKNNFLVVDDNGAELVKVVDFEMQSTHYAYRNRLHRAQIISMLGVYRFRCFHDRVLGSVLGFWWLLRYQVVSFSGRVRARQPSFLSLIVAEVRSFGGQILGKLLGKVGLGEE